jgi:hypothetical protein
MDTSDCPRMLRVGSENGCIDLSDDQDESRVRSLAWRFGTLSVESLGAMLGATSFTLADGRQVAPFQIAPWTTEGSWTELPAILRRLRGEWPCVPFGSDADRLAKDGWPASQAADTVDAFPHGFSANNDWQFAAESASRISLSIAYPAEHPIASLERHVTPDPLGAAIDFELVVNVRRDCVLPIGLHPCFRLPAVPGAMRIEADPGKGSATFPFDVDASSIFERGQFLERWNEVPLRDGSTLDVSRVPLAGATEEILQLLDMPGHASILNIAEGYRVRLNWDREHFPSALLWFSNRGRMAAPWNGRHLALGLEPICSAFDLGQQISAADNPISRRGVRTARAFSAGERFATRYRVEVEAAAAG